VKLHTTQIIKILFVALFWTSLAGPAATIWNGPLLSYTQPSPYPSLPANRDQLTARVSLTRESSSGMFNFVSEADYTHNFSPADTEWAVGELADYANLSYMSWEEAGSGSPVFELPGKQLVVHLLTDDIYLSLEFTALGGHGAGGFSYVRSTPAPNNPPPTLAVAVSGNALQISWPAPGGTLQARTNNLNGAWFNVPNTATTNRIVVQIDQANHSVFYRLALP